MADSITDEILKAIGDWIASIVGKVSEWLWSNFKPVFDAIGDWLGDVFGALEQTILKLKSFIGDVFNYITNKITSLVSDAIDFIADVFDRVANQITALFDSVTGYLADVVDSVIETIIGAGDIVAQWASDIYDEVVGYLKSIVQDVSQWLGELFDDVKIAVVTIIERATAVVDAIVQGIKDFISSVIDTVGGALRDLLEATAKIPDALANLGTGFAESVEEFIGVPLSKIPNAVWEKLGEMIQASSAMGADARGLFTDPLFSRTQSAPQSRDEWHTFFNSTMPESPTARIIFNTIISLFLVLRIGGGVADANAQIVLQEFGEAYPYNIPQVNDVIKLRHFNIIDEGQAVPLIRKQGYSEADAKRLIQIGETVPPEGEALSWWLRKIYSDADIDAALSRNGWNDKDREALKSAAFFIPPVQDLITMAVREVFTPEVAARFGQYEDYPEEFTEWAEKQGVSKEWAQRYWAAHWALPSVQMGFEMLHRGVIELDDMKLLLKSADVMPFWQDKIVAISYAPLTRVDIRRMHKLDILTETEVFKAYQDLGYDETNAQRLTDFTVELNRPAPVDDEVKLQELTRAGILGFYEDGLLTAEDTYQRLLDVGLSAEAASLYITAIDMDQQRQERKQSQGLILDQAKAGIISFERAQDLLSGLGLETIELTKALTTLVRQHAQRTKLPAKGDLDKMLLLGIIAEDEYIDTLKLLGYSDDWSDKLLTLLLETKGGNTSEG